jgi:hypothetical protein
MKCSRGKDDGHFNENRDGKSELKRKGEKTNALPLFDMSPIGYFDGSVPTNPSQTIRNLADHIGISLNGFSDTVFPFTEEDVSGSVKFMKTVVLLAMDIFITLSGMDLYRDKNTEYRLGWRCRHKGCSCSFQFHLRKLTEEEKRACVGMPECQYEKTAILVQAVDHDGGCEFDRASRFYVLPEAVVPPTPLNLGLVPERMRWMLVFRALQKRGLGDDKEKVKNAINGQHGPQVTLLLWLTEDVGLLNASDPLWNIPLKTLFDSYLPIDTCIGYCILNMYGVLVHKSRKS